MTLLWVTALTTHAQHQPAPRVYTYVEQMPELPGGGGQAAIVAEIQKRLKLPASKVEPNCYRVFPSFEVSATGIVQHARIKQHGGSAVVDSAVLQAVRSLPRFKPGRQAGHAVAVSFTIPMRIATQ
jgi:protein TonB